MNLLTTLNWVTEMLTAQILAGEKVGCLVVKRHHSRACVFLF